MKQNISIRKRKSAKHGVTYEYRFETASIGGQRKWISKGGFLDENTARMEGIKALNEYNTCGKVIEPTTMSFADFLEHWLVTDCAAALGEITIINYRKKVKNLIVPYLGKYRMNTIDRDKLQNLLITLHDNMICPDQFDVFLEAFESNPFKLNENKQFRKQLIDNIVKYAFDHTSLLTAALLIKKKFTIDEISQNYYSNIDMFGGNWY